MSSSDRVMKRTLGVGEGIGRPEKKRKGIYDISAHRLLAEGRIRQRSNLTTLSNLLYQVYSSPDTKKDFDAILLHIPPTQKTQRSRANDYHVRTLITYDLIPEPGTNHRVPDYATLKYSSKLYSGDTPMMHYTDTELIYTNTDFACWLSTLARLFNFVSAKFSKDKFRLDHPTTIIREKHEDTFAYEILTDTLIDHHELLVRYEIDRIDLQ